MKSKIGTRLRELEEALEHMVVLIGTKTTFTKTDKQVVELAVRAHGGIRNIFEGACACPEKLYEPGCAEPNDSTCEACSDGAESNEFGSPLARKVTEKVARDAVKMLFTRHSGGIEIHEGESTEAELEQDVVNVLLGDDTGCLDPEDVSDRNCTVLIVEKLLAGSAETGGEKAAPQNDELHKAAWELSTWAASINWDHRAKNTAEWLDGLRERIEAVQIFGKPETTFPRSSQNHTVSSGVEGAHEGTTADKSVALAESSLSQKCAKCPYDDRDPIHDNRAFPNYHKFESSLSSPPHPDDE